MEAPTASVEVAAPAAANVAAEPSAATDAPETAPPDTRGGERSEATVGSRAPGGPAVGVRKDAEADRPAPDEPVCHAVATSAERVSAEPDADERAARTAPVAAAEPVAAGPVDTRADRSAPRSAEPDDAEPRRHAAAGSPERNGRESVAAREPAGARSPAPVPAEIPVPGGWDETEPEDVPAGAVPDRFAEERPEPAAAESGGPPAGRRGRQTPDERAAEQAAADLALLRTFGFADPGLRPDSAPVIEMARPGEQEPLEAAGDAQPVRYRVIRRDGSVVGAAAVTLLDDRGGDVAAGTADAAGRGEVLAPSPGAYVLVSTAAGHQPGAVAIRVAGSATKADVLLARSASVSGTVHGEDGPIAGARVTLVQDGEAVDAVDTGADGAFRIGDIGAGEYGVSVAAAGCEPVATLLDVAEEADVRHDVELRPASPVADGDLEDGDLVDDVLTGLR
jgi:hypothetical protein